MLSVRRLSHFLLPCPVTSVFHLSVAVRTHTTLANLCPNLQYCGVRPFLFSNAVLIPSATRMYFSHDVVTVTDFDFYLYIYKLSLNL